MTKISFRAVFLALIATLAVYAQTAPASAAFDAYLFFDGK
jgi:hypothetical protein